MADNLLLNQALGISKVGYLSSDNSFNDTLDASESRIGEWIDTLNWNNIIIGISTTQDSSTDGLCICWSPDGITQTDSDTFSILANKSKVFTFCPARRYVKLIYVNGIVSSDVDLQTIFKKGGIKASSHRIQDMIVSEDDAELTKSVLTGRYEDAFINIEASIGGALKTAIEDGQTTMRVEIEPLGSMKTITPVRLVGTPFNNGTKDPNFWNETTTGSGAVTQAGKISLSTGTTADSSAQYDSIRKARKVTGTTNQFRMVGRLTTIPAADNVRRIGCYDDDNGFFFQVDGETFGVGSRKNGTDSIVENGSFNGNAGDTIEVTTDSYRFVIDYTSVAARFFVNGTLVHTLLSPTDTLTNTQDFKIRMENYNENGNIVDHNFDVRFATILRLGELITNPVAIAIDTATTTVLKYGAGILQRILNTNNAGTITVYDNTAGSGTKIATIDGVKTIGGLEFNAPFNNGLTIVTTGSAKITVVYE